MSKCVIGLIISNQELINIIWEGYWRLTFNFFESVHFKDKACPYLYGGGAFMFVFYVEKWTSYFSNVVELFEVL